jgi:hypothetical protein
MVATANQYFRGAAHYLLANSATVESQRLPGASNLVNSVTKTLTNS